VGVVEVYRADEELAAWNPKASGLPDVKAKGSSRTGVETKR
jgi:hypothetical protein